MREHLSSFEDKRILVVGDIMLDRFIYGNVSRISPEAPVPVVHISSQSSFPGGAANVARNLTPFAASVHVCGICGDDADGGRLLAELREGEVGISTVCIEESFSTICKTRVIAQQQQVVRIDQEQNAIDVEVPIDRVLNSVRELLPNLDAIILEDYAKGFLVPEIVTGVTDLAREAGVVITVDPCPRNQLPIRGVSAVKPNRLEAFVAADMIDTDPSAPAHEDARLHQVGRKLMEQWETPIVLITLGEQGMMLFERDQEPYHIPTRAQEVFDVSGAGDTAIALFTLALSAGMPAPLCAEISNHASGSVVGKLGTATVGPEDF